MSGDALYIACMFVCVMCYHFMSGANKTNKAL